MSKFLAIDSYGGNDIAAMSKYFEDNVYPYLVNKGLIKSPYFGPLARQPYVAPASVDPAVSLIVGSGHGTYTSFLGFQEEQVFAKGGYNPNEVSGKIIHLWSCETAQKLGPDFVSNGCKAYVGYDENFTFDPNNGETFFQCNAEFVLGLADGLSVGDAVTRAKDAYSTAINNLMNQGTTQSIETAQWLGYNLAHLRSPLDGQLWGDATVSLF